MPCPRPCHDSRDPHSRSFYARGPRPTEGLKGLDDVRVPLDGFGGGNYKLVRYRWTDARVQRNGVVLLGSH